MHHIVFKIFPASSHLNATYSFANELKNKGYKITYAGRKEFKKEVDEQGFNYLIDKDVIPHFQPSSRNPSLLSRIKSRKILNKNQENYLKGDGFDNIISILNPDLIIVDSPYVRHSIPLFNKRIPFMIFESMVALNKRFFYPPLCSKIIPKRNLYYKIKIELAWKKYFFTGFVERLLFGHPFPSKTKIKKLAKITGYPIENIDFNRYFHVGLMNIPELIASPFEFDFFRKKLNNQYYISTSSNIVRKEVNYDYKYLETQKYIEKIESFNELCSADERISLVYCSFGSMAWRYKGLTDFYKKLINVFYKMPNVKLFISVGYEASHHLFKKLPDNVQIFQRVPQLDLLKKMDLMITHGGMNTITECIKSEVPMLVYPGTNRIDQVGNACRVCFHKIGLMGSHKKDSQYMIKKKINQILSNTIYREKITAMKNMITQNNNASEALIIIDTILNKKTD